MKTISSFMKFIDENYENFNSDYNVLLNDESILLGYYEWQKKDPNIVGSDLRSCEEENPSPALTSIIVPEITRKSNYNYMLNNKDKWYIDGKVDELAFAKQYIENQPMIYYLKQFYDVNDVVNKNILENDILEILSQVIKSTQLRNSTKNILSFLETKCYVEYYKPERNTVHVKNATLYINEKQEIVIKPKEITINRLNVEYKEKTTKPYKWLNLLYQLLNENDITILQEYLGYCLLATTHMQKSLFIIGKVGGEGKSTILRIVKELFGKNCIIEKSLKKMLNTQFGFYGINNKLIVYDDETDPLENKMLESFKKFVSNDELAYEAKYENEVKLNHYARFISLGNNLFEKIRTDDTAFVRRLIILDVKPIKNRGNLNQDELVKEILKEDSLILNWCIEGLVRLIRNNYIFSYNDEMKEKVSSIVANNNTDYIEAFLKDTDYVQFKEEGQALSADLYDNYVIRCERFGNVEPVSRKLFFINLIKVAEKLGISYCERIYPSERRGYKGIELVTRSPYDN